MLYDEDDEILEFVMNNQEIRWYLLRLLFFLQISDSLVTFGIAETSRDLLVGIFDDESGEKMIEIAKKIDGRPASLDELPMIADYSLIKKVHFFLY